MKKIFTLLLLLFCCEFIFAQVHITPDKDLEYCPSTNYTFTIIVPGYSPNIFSWTNNPIVVTTNYPQVNPAASTTFTFIGKFQDVNIAQTYGVAYKRQNKADTTEYITFKKIKSFFASNPACGIIQPNLPSITAPACQVNTIPISFTKIKWFTQNETPALCFGAVDNYEYQIPVGWSIGGTTCINSNQWIAGSNNVSIVTDANSGDGGYVRIRPINSGCGAGLINGSAQTVAIPINRNPTFSINPGSFQVPCGTSTTQTVSVNLSIPSGCTVTYNWSLSNPFTYTYPTGGFVPQTFTTSTPSFTFVTPAFSGILPSISVTPVFNGVAQPTLICTASRTPIDPSQYAGFAIVGDNSICSSATYTAVNIPVGFTINWYTSTYPYGASVAQINSPTSPQTTVTAIGSGVISLIAELTNQCGQTVSVTKSNISVGGGINTINGYFTNYLGQMEALKTNYQGINYIRPNYWTNAVISNPELSTATWSWITGGYNYWSQAQFPPTGGTILQMSLPITNNIVLYRLTNNSSCGTQAIDFLFWAKEAPYGPYYLLSPNPATDVVKVDGYDSVAQTQNYRTYKSSSIATKSGSIEKRATIKAIEIIDMTGVIRYRKDCSDLNSNILVVPVDKLNNGVYIMKIFNGKVWKSEKFIIQR